MVPHRAAMVLALIASLGTVKGTATRTRPLGGDGRGRSSSSSSSIASLSSDASFSYFQPPMDSHALALMDDRDPKCPPCFNCNLESFKCLQYGHCNARDGSCSCPDGFGGISCDSALDGSLADGKDRPIREGSEPQCKPGFSGLLCNVCETNEACKPLVPDDSDTPIRPSSSGLTVKYDDAQREDTAVCYKGGFVVNKMHQMCDVTNRKILEMLPGRPPQVTFTCEKEDATCGFQFWVGGKESFYCGLEQCEAKAENTAHANVTKYDCQKIECSCIPGRMLCGESGSVNIDDFLDEEIKGPGTFSCRDDGSGCYFSEPAMNQLINDIFGDEHITLQCNSGECLHYSAVPGFERPAPPDNSKLVAASIAVTGLGVVIACALFWYLGRTTRTADAGRIRLGAGADEGDNDGDEVSKLMANHVPASVSFDNLSYTAPTGRKVLSGVSGIVQPGQLLAIMGASGAGKSTFLDILAKKAKRGQVGGQVTVNGSVLSGEKYRRIVGFVDQEDTLMGTLTVYETVLYSALLRLPREMSLEAKRMRTLETMHELGILAIKDSRIGESGKRSISGGEKRRVSIACELVTSPSILFLDEPTSGLDAFNAINVIECLSGLAKNYNRTVVFTIHQPRSNIVTLFDQLLLLAGGRAVYSGEYAKCQDYFDSIGHPCPPGYNIADFLIDLTMQDERAPSSATTVSDQCGNGIAADEESATPHMGHSPRAPTFDGDTELRRRTHAKQQNKDRWSLFSSSTPSSPTTSQSLGPHLTQLVEAYEQSDIAQSIKESARSQSENGHGNGGHSLADQQNLEKLAGFKQASLWTQFTILSGRAFKNLYRNPMLMLSHYVVSVAVALLCSFLFARVTNDIPGFQNRMGLFFFVLALFGFSCLTSLDAFAKERVLFMRERSNGYYSPATYFTSKVLFDVLPLRVIPPFILGAIIYRPVGLVPTVAEFWKFILVLILFNLSASSVVFFISIVISNSGVANLVGSLVMLFNLLFAGLLVNRDKVPLGIGWLQTISFFHAAFEGLLVNEVRYLQLKDHRYGVDIEVPAATILSMFGFRAQAFWYPDVMVLCVYFIGFLLLSYIALVILVKERR